MKVVLQSILVATDKYWGSLESMRSGVLADCRFKILVKYSNFISSSYLYDVRKRKQVSNLH